MHLMYYWVHTKVSNILNELWTQPEPLRLCTVLPGYERASWRTCHGRMPIFIFLLMYDKKVAVQLGIES